MMSLFLWNIYGLIATISAVLGTMNKWNSSTTLRLILRNPRKVVSHFERRVYNSSCNSYKNHLNPPMAEGNRSWVLFFRFLLGNYQQMHQGSKSLIPRTRFYEPSK
ncbi:unnamed protein product [Cochlearia groenlandica]